MHNLHHQLMRRNGLYARWHQHPITNTLHFVVLIVIAVSLAVLIIKTQTPLNLIFGQKDRSLANVTTGVSGQAVSNPITVSSLTSSAINFSWPAITGATGYKIYLAPEPTSLNTPTERKLLTTLPATTLNYQISNLAANVDLFIRVEGVGTSDYYDLYAKTLGGQQAKLDNFITNGEAGTAIQSVSLYAPNILLLVIKDKKVQSFSSTDNTLDKGDDRLKNYTGPTWQTNTWNITRNNNSPIPVTNIYRDSIPVGNLYDELADRKKPALGMYSHLMDVEHHIYLKLNQNIGTKDILNITGPNGLKLTIPYSDKYLETPVIQVNQVGYNPRASERYAYISGWMGDGGRLNLTNFPNNAGILTETSNPFTPYNLDLNIPIKSRSATDFDAGTEVKDVSLSSITANDSVFYRVHIPGVGVSYRTMVSELATLKAYYVISRGLFLNRWGRDLDCNYTDWCDRPKDHSSESTISFPGVYENDLPTGSNSRFSTENPPAQINPRPLTGGHHDAGDFDIKSQHYQVANQLMRAYEINTQPLSTIKLNIPESSNNIPDLLDEALYSIKAWEQLQDEDGGVRMGVESHSHPGGFYFADTDSLPYWTLPKDPTHSLRVAGLFAQASRLVKPFDASRSETLKTKAIKAYDYAIANGITNSVGGPMEYAAGELYRLSKLYPSMDGSRYKNRFETTWQDNLSKNPPKNSPNRPDIRPLENWTSVYSLPKNAVQPILANHVLGYLGVLNDPTVASYTPLVEKQMVEKAEITKSTINQTYAHRNSRQAGWNSAWGKSVALGEYLIPIYSKIQLELNRGITKRDQTDINAISLSADYILGANPMGMSWVTGLGSRSPQNPLHADSIAFTITKDLPPIPGIPVYGPVEAGNPAYYDFGKNVTYPAIINRPPLRKYVDLRSFVNNNEFTVWETQSNVASLFASLVGNLNIPTSWQPGRSDHKNKLPLNEQVKSISTTGSYNGSILPIPIATTTPTIPTPPTPEPPTSNPVTKIEMINVPAGTFPMGRNSTNSSAPESPQHNVTLSAYQIGKFEVTNNQYIEFLNDSRTSLKKLKDGKYQTWDGGRYDDIYGGTSPQLLLGFRLAEVSITFDSTKKEFIPKTKPTKTGTTESMGNYPATDVTWYGAVMYTNWLSQKEGLQPVYNTTTWTADLSKNGYRLPTEAEWERAAAWDGTKHWDYAFSSNTLSGKTRANYYDGSYINPAGGGDLNNSYYVNPMGLIQDALTPYTSPVGWFNGANTSPNGNVKTIKTTSPIGAYDMSGNVFEWINDWYNPNYYISSPSTNPSGPTASPNNTKVIRGGGWGRIVGAQNSRTYIRKGYLQTTADGVIGFRLAKNGSASSLVPATPPTPTTPSPATPPNPNVTTPASPTGINISLVAPANNSTISGRFLMKAIAGPSVVQARFYIDNKLIYPDRSLPFSVTWDSKRFSNGSHTIKVEARDISGNIIGQPNEITVTFKNPTSKNIGPLNLSNIFDTLNNLFKRLFNWWR